MKLKLFKNRKEMNKKGAIWLTLWLIPAIAASLGYLINALKPATPAPTGIMGIMSSLPIWFWIIGILILLVLLRR